MEKDESNYHPLVNLIRESMATTGTVASFLLSLLLISFFEYAFHYLGGQYAEQRALLLCHGYDITRQQRQPPRLADGTFHRPAPPLETVPCTVSASDSGPLHVHVEDSPHVHVADESSDLSSVYNKAEQAKVGQEIECVQCGTSFRKANKWHTFCTPKCRDSWHNTQNPERMIAASKRGRAVG